MLLGCLIVPGVAFALVALIYQGSRKKLIVDAFSNQFSLVDDMRLWRNVRSFDLKDLSLMTHEVTLYGNRALNPVWLGYSLIVHTPLGVWFALVTKKDEWEINEYRSRLPPEIGQRYAGPGPPLSARY